MIQKIVSTILITKAQKEWVNDNAINLSKWVRKKLDEVMEK